MKIETIPIDKIQLGKRFRNDPGDVEGLAANINELGLLQPIGVDPYYQLIFGYRRLWACKDILAWSTIPAIVFDLDSLLAGEYAENEFRKQFTPSERAAIGKAIEAELGDRRGGDRSKPAIAGNAPKGETVDLAAKRAGFKSAETFERAKAVTTKGTPELIAAMDSGKVSIDAAAKIATQPKPEQNRIVELPKEKQQEIVRQIRKTKADREADERRAYDLRVYRGLADAVEQIARHCDSAKATWEGLERVSAFAFSENLDRAIACLVRLQKEHPNAPPRPNVVKKATQ